MLGRRRRRKGSPEKPARRGSGALALGCGRRLLEVMGRARAVEGEERGLGLGLSGAGNGVVFGIVVRG